MNNSSNELTSTPSATYTYDNNGNTLTSVTGSNTTTYAWDFENRLSSVTLPGSGGTVTFKYDPFGRRIYKSSSSGTSVFAYDGANLIEETNASGGVVARYEDTQNIDEPLAMLRSSATSYYHADGLGSVTSLSNGAGSLANTYTYDSFGKLTNSTGSLTNPFRYTARESDTETGLYYYRARYYDSSLGRFLLEDPLDFAGGKNFYRYVGNNPVKRKDPLGLWQFTIGGGLGLGAQLTFGNNSGQYNFGLSSGVGEGAYFHFDPTDSGGCHKGGAYAVTNVHLGLGAGHVHGTVDATLEDGNPPSGDIAVVFPSGGGISWNPMEPHEPPHGIIEVGVGLFGGVGFSFHSPPTNCGCQ